MPYETPTPVRVLKLQAIESDDVPYPGTGEAQMFVDDDTGEFVLRYGNGTETRLTRGEQVTTGTWTPGIVGATTPGTQTYSINAGYYTKRGKLVHVRGEITLTANSDGVGDAQITLPFTSAAGTKQALTISYISNVTLAGFASMKIDASAAFCKLKDNTSGGASSTVAITAFAATASIAFSGTYEAAT